MRAVGVSAIFALLLSAGCSHAPDPTARLANMPKPGNVRLLNLSATPATLLYHNQDLCGPTAPGKESPYLGVSPKTTSVSVSTGGHTTEVPIKTESGQGTTIAWYGSKFSTYAGDTILAQTGTSLLRVVYVDQNQGKAPYDSVDVNGDKLKVGGEAGTVRVGPNKVTLPGGQKVEYDADDCESYTLYLIKGTSGKVEPRVLRNNPALKAKTAGSSKS